MAMTDELKNRPATYLRRDDHETPPRETHLIRGSADYEDMLDRLSKGVTVAREPKHP
jgi:hypothetical protein